MNCRKDIVLHIWFAYIMFYVCFKHFFVNDDFLYIILDALFLMVMVKGIYKNIKIKGDVCWCFYFILLADMLFSVFYAVSFADGVKFTVIYINIIIIAFWFTQMPGWQDVFYKWMRAGCLFHLCFTFFSFFFTEQALRITEKFLTRQAQDLTVGWSQLHLYAGIAGQTGTNAFFFSVLIGLSLAQLCAKCGHRLLDSVLLICSCLGLWFTGKKGFMIAAVLSGLAVCWLAGGKLQKKAVLLFAAFGAGMAGIAAIVWQDRIYNLFYVSVVSRIRILEGMLGAIRQKPVFGHGVNSAVKFTYENHLGHNIYLQMWVEQGVIGVGILLAALFFTLYLTCARMRKSQNEGEICSTYYVSVYMQIFVIIYGFYGNPIYDYNFAIILYLSIAAAFAGNHYIRGKGETIDAVPGLTHTIHNIKTGY